MSEPGTAFTRLEDVILDESFPDVDLALRRGRHLDRDHGAAYTFLCDAQEHLEAFYRRFGCELVRRSEGYFYLLPSGDRLGRRQLSLAEMLVGQTLTLLYLDPTTVQGGGLTTRAEVLSHLASVMGTESLIRALNPKRKRYDERVAQETVRARVSDALRRLATLGFVDSVGEEQLRLRPALMRFAEPVRSAAAPAEALERLVAAGEVVLAAEEPDGGEEESSEPEDDYAGIDLSGLEIGEDVTRQAPPTEPEFDAFDSVEELTPEPPTEPEFDEFDSAADTAEDSARDVPTQPKLEEVEG
jgi:chromosome partition protein MukE